MTAPSPSTAFLIILVVIAVVLTGVLVGPIASPLFLACVVATTLDPIQERLSRRFSNRRRLVAALLTLAVVVLVLLPLAIVAIVIVNEAGAGISYVRETLETGGVSGLIEKMPEPLQRLASQLRDVVPASDEDVRELVRSGGGGAVQIVGGALRASGRMAIQTALFVIALYALLLDGRRLVGWLRDSMPLKPAQAAVLMSEFHQVSIAVLVSTVLTSAIQTAVALIGYLIASVPYVFFFSFLTFVVSFIPAVGAASVVVVVSGFVLLSGQPGMALFLALWGLIVVGLSDNVSKSWLLGGRTNLHGAVVFFALVGGLAAFGPVGIVAGPLCVSFLLAVVRLLRHDSGQLIVATEQIAGDR